MADTSIASYWPDNTCGSKNATTRVKLDGKTIMTIPIEILADKRGDFPQDKTPPISP